AATLPSTVAVAVLACVALFLRPTLAALLAGVEAGRGVAALISLGRIDPELLVDPRNSAVYRRGGGAGLRRGAGERPLFRAPRPGLPPDLVLSGRELSSRPPARSRA